MGEPRKYLSPDELKELYDKKGGLLKLRNQFTFRKSKLLKLEESNKKDMRSKIMRSDRVTYNVNRVKKAANGTQFASYIPTITKDEDIKLPEILSYTPYSDFSLSGYNPYAYLSLYSIEEMPIDNVEVSTPTPVVNKTKVVKYKGKAIDINKAIETLNEGAKNPTAHKCTRYVSNALEGITDINHASGVENPEAMYKLLLLNGWRNVLDDNYTPLKGDVYVTWGLPSGGKNNMHTSMYNGSEWVSYTKEGSTPYYFNNKIPGKTFVMRGKYGMKIRFGKEGLKYASYLSTPEIPETPKEPEKPYVPHSTTLPFIDSWNPKDWFRRNYSTDVSFGDAFNDARDAGSTRFLWNDDPYNTELKKEEIKLPEEKKELDLSELDIYHHFKSNSPKEFAQVMKPIFARALAENGYSSANLNNMIRLAAYESSYGLKSLGSKKYNLGGIKWFGDSNYRHSKNPKDSLEYIDFNDLYEYANYVVQLLHNRYGADTAKDTLDYVERLHGKNPTKSNYSSNKSGYRKSLLTMLTLDKYLK